MVTHIVCLGIIPVVFAWKNALPGPGEMAFPVAGASPFPCTGRSWVPDISREQPCAQLGLRRPHMALCSALGLRTSYNKLPLVFPLKLLGYHFSQ